MLRWQKHLRSHETEVLDDASHFVQEHRPDRVAVSIRRVLERPKIERRSEASRDFAKRALSLGLATGAAFARQFRAASG